MDNVLGIHFRPVPDKGPRVVDEPLTFTLKKRADIPFLHFVLQCL